MLSRPQPGWSEPLATTTARRLPTSCVRGPCAGCSRANPEPLLDHGDELVVEELLSAAVIDRQMRQLAGHHSPPADVGLFRRAAERGAELGVPVDAAFCDRTHPTAPAAAACRDLLR